jgi:hypothetical protein
VRGSFHDSYLATRGFSRLPAIKHCSWKLKRLWQAACGTLASFMRICLDNWTFFDCELSLTSAFIAYARDFPQHLLSQTNLAPNTSIDSSIVDLPNNLACLVGAPNALFPQVAPTDPLPPSPPIPANIANLKAARGAGSATGQTLTVWQKQTARTPTPSQPCISPSPTAHRRNDYRRYRKSSSRDARSLHSSGPGPAKRTVHRIHLDTARISFM